MKPSGVRVTPFGERSVLVTLDRPPVNAANTRLLESLYDAVDGLRHLPDIDAVVITGSGRAFCAGNDLDEFEAMNSDTAAELMYIVRRAFWAVYDCPMPVIAMVNGAALGTGLALAACCDLIVASDTSSFGLPELTVGVLGGLKFAARLVPELAVRRLYFTAESVSASEFAAMGAPLTVVPHEELRSTTEALVAQITDKSSVALRFAKQAMNAVEHMDLKGGYEYEQTFTIRMADREESKHAVRAVIEQIRSRQRGRADGAGPSATT